MNDRTRWVAPATATAVVLAAGAVIAQDAQDRSVGEITLWSGGDAGLLWLVGLALCAGAAVSPRAREGLLISIVAVGWVAPVFAMWAGGLGMAEAAAPGLAALVVPALWQLLVDGTVRARRARRRAGAVVWVVSAAGAVVLLLFRDPFLDPRCQGECVSNPLLVIPLPRLVANTFLVLDAVAIIVAGAALVWALRCLVRRYRIVELAPVPALVAGGIAATAAWLTAGAEISAAGVLEPVIAGSLALLAVVRIVIGVAALLRAAALRRLGDDLVYGAGDDLRSRLAATFDIPDLDVLYALSDGRWVDASGRPRERPDGSRGTELRREGKAVALVVGLREGEAAIGSAASLAIDNERMRAEISAHLADVRRSRLTIVEIGDDERRRIERNLHDGMQQSLLILQYELGLAATRVDDPAYAATLAALRAEAHGITERLREIAHGVFPAALDDLGVESALQRLVDDAPFPLEVAGAADRRAPRPVERTVYLVANEALAAGSTHDSLMRIDLAAVGDTVSVRTRNATTSASPGLQDRVEALGGRITVREDGLEVELPCASL